MTSFPWAAPLLFAATVLGVANGLLPLPALWWAAAVVMLASIAALWPHARPQSRRLAAVFVLLTAVAMFWAPPRAVLEAAVQAAEVVAILTSAQLLASALKSGHYDRVVRRLLAGMRWHPTWIALVSGYLLSWPFALTAIPVVYSSLFDGEDPSGPASDPAVSPSGRPSATPLQVDTAILLARAFGAAAIAAPSQPTVLLAVAVAGAPLLPFLALAIPLSWLMLLMGLFGFNRRPTQRGQHGLQARPMAAAAAADGPQGTLGYVLLAGLFLSLAAAIIGVSQLPVRVVAGMAAAIMIAAAIWGDVGRRYLAPAGPPARPRWDVAARDYIVRLADGALLVAAGSLAGFTLTHTPLVETAATLLRQVRIPVLAAALTLVIMLALRLLGVAPAVIILTVGPVLADTLPLTSVALAILLAAGSFLSFLLSPFSMTSAMVSSLTGASPVEVSLPRNGTYVLLSALLIVLYVTAFASLLG